MKRLEFYILVFTIILVSACGRQTTNPGFPYDQINCTEVIIPYCGSDGEYYHQTDGCAEITNLDGEPIADDIGIIEWDECCENTEGLSGQVLQECEVPVACTSIYKYMCGSDGQYYHQTDGCSEMIDLGVNTKPDNITIVEWNICYENIADIPDLVVLECE